MARRQPLKARLFMMVDGERKPVLTIDESGKVEYAMPKDEMLSYEKRILKNVEKAETDYYLQKEVAI